MSEVVILEEISCESGDGIIQKWIINRPSKLNALNQEVTSAIKSLCQEVENRPDVRLIIISGSPPLPVEEGKRQKPVSFIAGADITEFAGKNSTEIEPDEEASAPRTLSVAAQVQCLQKRKQGQATVLGRVEENTHRARMNLLELARERNSNRLELRECRCELRGRGVHENLLEITIEAFHCRGRLQLSNDNKFIKLTGEPATLQQVEPM